MDPEARNFHFDRKISPTLQRPNTIDANATPFNPLICVHNKSQITLNAIYYQIKLNSLTEIRWFLRVYFIQIGALNDVFATGNANPF